MVNVESGKIFIVLDVKPHYLNSLGIVYGGVLSSILDNAMGLAVMFTQPDEKTVTTNLKVYYAVVRSGMLTVMADIVHESHKMITDIAKVVGRNGWCRRWAPVIRTRVRM